MNILRDWFFGGALAFCVMQPIGAWAVPDEVQVYTEEMNIPGQLGVEQHVNYSLSGTQLPDYPGQLPTHHVVQFTPELAYGLTNNLEGGMYLPLAFAPDGNSYLNGLRLRLKYIAPRQSDEKMFYGLNLEAGSNSLRISESSSEVEVRPIVGYRGAVWMMSFNPILNTGLADNVSHQPQFKPALKLAYRAHESVQTGLEYYGEYGALNNLSPMNQAVHTVYAVMDVETSAFDANFGVGHGFAYAPDAWAVKAIISLPLK